RVPGDRQRRRLRQAGKSRRRSAAPEGNAWRYGALALHLRRQHGCLHPVVHGPGQLAHHGAGERSGSREPGEAWTGWHAGRRRVRGGTGWSRARARDRSLPGRVERRLRRLARPAAEGRRARGCHMPERRPGATAMHQVAYRVDGVLDRIAGKLRPGRTEARDVRNRGRWRSVRHGCPQWAAAASMANPADLPLAPLRMTAPMLAAVHRMRSHAGTDTVVPAAGKEAERIEQAPETATIETDWHGDTPLARGRRGPGHASAPARGA